MWLFVAFDLPVETPEMRKVYRVFRKQLENMGFISWQKSLFFRKCFEPGQTTEFKKKISSISPALGNILIIAIPPDIMRTSVCLFNQVPMEIFLQQEPMTLL